MGGTGAGAAGMRSALVSFTFVQIAQHSSVNALGWSRGAEGRVPATSPLDGTKAANTVELLLNLPR